MCEKLFENVAALTLSNNRQDLLTEFTLTLWHRSTMAYHVSSIARTIPALLLLWLCAVSPLAVAEAIDCITSSSPDSVGASADSLPRCDALHPEGEAASTQSNWRFGATIGYGERENPLINAKDDAIYGFLHISYFGEKFFFDNGDFGWALDAGDDWSLNLIAGIGGERSFFSFFDDSSGGFAPGFGTPAFPGQPEDFSMEQLAAIEAPDRDRTIDAGIELIANWHDSEIMLQVLSDISDRHNGQEAWLSWALPRSYGRWDIVPSTGFVWKSEKNTDYYFGVRPDEVQPGLPQYQAGQSMNPFARLSITYNLNSHWKIVSVLRYEKLHGEITDSPMVVEDSVTTAFVGLHYAF